MPICCSELETRKTQGLFIAVSPIHRDYDANETFHK